MTNKQQTDETDRYSILHQNVQCIRNKLTQLNLLMANLQTDILCVTEHWLREEELASINVTGYVKANFFCRSRYSHGGVGIFIRNGIQFKKLRTNSSEKHFECVAVQCSLGNENFVIVVIYRSPSSAIEFFCEELHETLKNILYKHPKAKLALCGDFNVNFLVKSKNLTMLSDVLDTYALVPTINNNTRGRNCIDNICVNLDMGNYDIQNILTHISDHEAAQLLKICSKPKNKNDKITYYYRDFRNPDNIIRFRSLIANESWEEVYRTDFNTNRKFEIFLKLLTYHFEVSFPLKKRTINLNIKKRKPWLTTGLIISCQNMKDLYKLTLSGDREINQYYKEYKRVYRKVLNRAVKLYNNELISNSSNKCRTAWKIIKEQGNQRKECNNFTLQVNDELITDPQALSNKFNEYFNSISKLTRSNGSCSSANTLKTQHNNTFYFIPATEYDTLDIINNLKNTTSSDFMINTVLLKKIKENVVRPLTYLINNSLEEGIFPDCLKTAKITPIHKSGETTNIQNFRPISQLSPIAKVLEKYVSSCILKYFDKYNLFNKNQFGFRKNKSTNNAIVEFLNMLLESLDKGNKVLGIFIDLSKAFDTVNHDLLMEKLERYGFRGIAYNWVSSYLSCRKHYVAINGMRSNTLINNMGVPQGSVLGPILYLIYVNDFPITNTIMYADDTSMIISDVNDEEVCRKASQEITTAQDWFSDNQMKLNEKKTHFIRFSHSNKTNDTSMLVRAHSKSIEQVQTVKFLGVEISESCKWDAHIDKLCKRLLSIASCIYQLRQSIDKSTLIMYYHAQFHSVMSYGISAWGASSYALRIFKIQKRVIRTISILKKRESCKTSFMALNILTMPCEYIYKTLVYMKTNIVQFQPLGCSSYNTRNKLTLEVTKHNLRATEFNPNYMGIKLFNKLPMNIRQLETKQFKKEVKKMLISKSYYSINEYLGSLTF